MINCAVNYGRNESMDGGAMPSDSQENDRSNEHVGEVTASSQSQIPLWRKLILKLSPVWIPFVAMLVITAFFYWRAEGWLPGVMEKAGANLSKLLVYDAIFAAPLVVLGVVIVLLSWKFSPSRLLAARSWTGVLQFLLAFPVTLLLFACLFLHATEAYILVNDNSSASKICKFVLLQGKYVPALRSIWFTTLAGASLSSPQGSEYLWRIASLLERTDSKNESLLWIYRKLIESCRKANDIPGQIRYQKAWIQAYERLKARGPREMCLVSNRQAVMLINQKAFAEAESVLKRAEPELEKLNDSSLRATLLINQLGIYDLQGLFAKADHVANKLGDIPVDQIHSDSLKSELAYVLGTHAANKGNYAEAHKHLERSLGLLERMYASDKSQSTNYSWRVSSLADVFVAEGKFDQAELAYKRALKINNFDMHALIGLACLFDKEKSYAKADFIYSLAENSPNLPDSGAANCRLSVDRLKRILSLLPPEQLAQLEKKVDYLKSMHSSSFNFSYAPEFLVLDLRPLFFDVRKPPRLNGLPPNPSTAVDAEIIASCLARCDREKVASNLPWAKEWYRESSNQLRNRIIEKHLPGSVLKPVTFKELMPAQFVVIDDSDIVKLCSLLGIPQSDLEKLINIKSYDRHFGRFGIVVEHSRDNESVYLKRLQLLEDVFDKESLPVASGLSDLGDLYFDIGNYEKSEQYYKQSVSILERLLGRDNLNTRRARASLLWLYQTTGDKKKADAIRPLAEQSTSPEKVVFCDYRRGPIPRNPPKIPQGIYWDMFVNLAKDQSIGGNVLNSSTASDSGFVVAPNSSIIFIDSEYTTSPAEESLFEAVSSPTDAIVIPGANSLGTVIRASQARKLLEQIDPKMALRSFEFARDCGIGQRVSAVLPNTILILDLRPFVIDLRTDLFDRSKLKPDILVPKGELTATVSGGVVVTGETVRACLSGLDKATIARDFPYLQKYIPKKEELLREQLPTASLASSDEVKYENGGKAASIKEPQTLVDLMPCSYFIFPPDKWAAFRKAANIPSEELAKIREQYGPNKLTITFPPPPMAYIEAKPALQVIEDKAIQGSKAAPIESSSEPSGKQKEADSLKP